MLESKMHKQNLDGESGAGGIVVLDGPVLNSTTSSRSWCSSWCPSAPGPTEGPRADGPRDRPLRNTC